MKCGRRDFLKAAGASAAGVILAGRDVLGMGCKERPGEVAVEAYPRRILGKTGEQVSMIAFGGIVVKDAEPAHAAKAVGEAFARGINYFDVAPTYGDAELKLGPALKPYRDKVFLACKTQKRDRAGAEQELRESLQRLQTNRFDLYQLHAITDVKEDVEAALGKGGAMEAILEARRQGLVRYIGFSAHSAEAALAAMREFEFDTAMYPVNFVCHYKSGFETEVLAEAKGQGMGIIALKAIAKQRWRGPKRYEKCWYEPIDERELARKALSWTLAQGVSVAIPPGEEELWRLAVELGPECGEPTGIELAELEQIASRCRAIFSSGRG
jgi:aryl-alcohol dehydrogenase-like predicted oxidoreductase